MAKRKRETRIQKTLRSDGALCVTFVNTGLGQRRPIETYDDLLAWSVRTSALGAADAERLERAAAERPGPTDGTLRRATTLRSRLERIFLAVVQGDRPAKADLKALNHELAAALGHRQLTTTDIDFQWTWQADEDDEPARMLWPILLSAGELLASEDCRRIRQCPSPGCGLFFVARSAGRARKWCGRACRDRDSSRRHYRKIIKPRQDRLASQRQARQKAGLMGYEDS